MKKAMTTKYPSSLVLLELAEELAAKNVRLESHLDSARSESASGQPHEREVREF